MMKSDTVAASAAYHDKAQMIRVLLGKSGPVIALMILSIALSFLSDHFLTTSNLINITRQAASSGFIALAMLLAILTAGIDLSVGSLMALSSMLLGMMAVKWGVNPYLALVLCLAIGAGLGFINGLLLTRLHLPHPFISTLGTQNIYRGITLIISMATPISVMPLPIKWPGAAFLGESVPVSFVMLIVAYIIFAIFLGKTRLGRHIYAVGGNVNAARLSGIDVKFTLNAVYTISGLMCAIAGIILTGRVDAVYPLAGLSWETDAIAAVIIGGASFFGGRGTVIGTLAGVFIIAILRNGLNLLGISADAQTVILGTVIILAVYIDVLKNKGAFHEKMDKLRAFFSGKKEVVS